MEIYNISSDYVMVRPERTDVRARYSLLSGDYLPLWGLRGIASWSLMTLERSGKGLSLQTAVCLTERSELWMVAFCGFRRKT